MSPAGERPAPHPDVASLGPGSTGAGWLSRFERFDMVGSTNDVVAGWLREGTDEVCLAVADVQAAGRGRSGRSWSAPPGASLLLSVGFRPTWIEPEHAWRLGAIVSVAMAEACEKAVGLRPGSVHLKWPNDLVSLDRDSGSIRKLAGVLGETDGLGTDDARAVIGIGVNASWDRRAFPGDLAASMTSLSELVPGQMVDREVVLHVFLERLEAAVAGLRDGDFDAETWRRRQMTSGMLVRLERPDGGAEVVSAVDVDPASGALLVRSRDEDVDAATHPVLVGEIQHLRVGGVV
jgi:BirA family biotin operon repressor/biotin-[acetyl-CoA-carboxylase] ligase